MKVQNLCSPYQRIFIQDKPVRNVPVERFETFLK